MMGTLIQILEAVAPSLICGIVLGVWNRRQNKKNNEQEAREKTVLQKEILQLDLLLATAQLSYAVAMAIKRGTPNGEMEEAISQYNKAMVEFRRFEREKLARHEHD